MNFQHYPTPPALAERMWKKFKNREFKRVLEPHAGKGDLLGTEIYIGGKPLCEWEPGEPWLAMSPSACFRWDAIEIDPQFHPRLRALGGTIVGYDFLKHESCAQYSHVIMNPPFQSGATHVLHAWNTLYDGEICALINAETLRNPFSRERQHLLELIEEHGDVEYVPNAFKGAGVERQADVDAAIVHLTKKASLSKFVSGFIDTLKAEEFDKDGVDLKTPKELAIPEGFVERTVRNFKMADRAALEAAQASAVAARYAARLGDTFEEMQNKDKTAANRKAPPPEVIARDEYASKRASLMSAAWAQIVRSTHVLERLSSQAQVRVESEFEQIKALEFSASNVHGFLLGLVQCSSQIQTEMMLDVFDRVTEFRTGNSVLYAGWKSNDRHMTAGKRLKRTRFILPEFQMSSYGTLDFYQQRKLHDMDLVFWMLDGKSKQRHEKPDPSMPLEEFGLLDLFTCKEKMSALYANQRISTAYFDVRFFNGTGTIHFFPRRMDIIDRLNRLVGQHRKWLPQDYENTPADFRRQYEQAEAFESDFAKALKKMDRGVIYEAFDHAELRMSEKATPEHTLRRQERLAEVKRKREEASARLGALLVDVLEAKGLKPFAYIEGEQQQVPLLAA